MKKHLYNKVPVSEKFELVMTNYLAGGLDKKTATVNTVTALLLLNYSEDEIRRAISKSPNHAADTLDNLKIFESVVADKKRIAFLKSLPWEEPEMKEAKKHRDNTEPDIDIANINRAAVG